MAINTSQNVTVNDVVNLYQFFYIDFLGRKRQNKHITKQRYQEITMNQLLKNNSDNWLENRAAFQNQTATFLEDNEDATADIVNTKQPQNLFASSPQISSATPKVQTQKRSQPLLSVTNQKGKTQLVNYKLIKITRLEQLHYFKNLVTLDTWEYLHNRQGNLNIMGIVAEAGRKKIGLVLAEVAPNNRVAKTISSIVDSEHEGKIAVRLIQCLEKSLHKHNCQRIIWHPQAKVLKRQLV